MGAFILELDENYDEIKINDKLYPIEEAEKYFSHSSCNLIIQRRLIQHPQMNEIYPNSLNTIRIVTRYNNGIPEIVVSVLRVGSLWRICR